MSSMVCQGLQSCLEPRFVEPRLKMVATKSQFLKPIKWAESLRVSESDSDTEEGIDENKDKSNDNKNIPEKNGVNSDADLGGWSFIQAPTNTSQSVSIEAKEDQQKPYVHPLSKHSASQLSTKSLELCTETLGSETGSDIGDDIDMSFSSSDSESSKSPTKERSKLRNAFGWKKVNYGSLPPPLTSITGSNCYSIRPHREGGRLVMKAVLVPSSNTCFQAERRDGRLKLHYIKNFDSPSSSDYKQEQVEHEGNEQDYLAEEVDGNNANAGGEIGMGKIQRPSRCKEGGRGNKGLLIWEPFWVAT